MKALPAGALLLATAQLAGCGQLHVAVHVPDPQHVRNEIVEEGRRHLYRQIVAAQPGDFAARIDRNFKDYQREMLVLVKNYEALAKKFPPAPASVLKNAAADLRQSAAGAAAAPDTRAETQALPIGAQLSGVPVAGTTIDGGTVGTFCSVVTPAPSYKVVHEDFDMCVLVFHDSLRLAPPGTVGPDCPADC